MNNEKLKQLIKLIVTEIIAAKKERLSETKGLSGNTKASDKKDNTEMKSDAKSITSTDKPVEKEEGKKLPVKDKKSNTETDHKAANKSTPVVPSGEKKEPARPVGGHSAEKDGGMKSNGLKEEITSMIREALEAHRMQEMAKKPVAFDGKKLTGSISNSLRAKVGKSPTGWALAVDYKMKDGKLVPAGTPVDAPTMTGKNYVAKGVPGMGRPKAASATNSSEGSQLTVSAEINGEVAPLEFDFLNSTWPQAKSFIESEIMANLGDAALDPNVKVGQEVYDAIEKAKEADLDGKLNNSNNKIVLFFDPASKQLKAKTTVAESTDIDAEDDEWEMTPEDKREMERARKDWEQHRGSASGYDRNDPKHPDYMERMTSMSDMARDFARDSAAEDELDK